jgi:hypothetical protein
MSSRRHVHVAVKAPGDEGVELRRVDAQALAAEDECREPPGVNQAAHLALGYLEHRRDLGGRERGRGGGEVGHDADDLLLLLAQHRRPRLNHPAIPPVARTSSATRVT